MIILLSAAKSQFVPLTESIAAASGLARREGVTTFDEGAAAELLALPRREVMERLDGRIEGFARCGRQRLDAWVDQYRLEKRIPLARVLVALSLPAEAWKKPPRQDYVAQLLGHFEKRIGTSVSRGALARMTIGKSSPRIDLTEVGTRRTRATALLDHLIERTDVAIDIDPAAFEAEANVEHRLRTLVRRADLQRRETGINGLYLGFPFVLMRPRGDDGKARIAPVLLWPVAVQTEVGQRARFRLAFDRDREEVRLNPALQSMLAPDAYTAWEAVCEQALAGAANAAAIMDELGGLTNKVRDRVLAKLPGADTKVAADKIELTSAAVLFHVTFVGQAIVEDIRHLQNRPPVGSGLETLLRSAQDQQKPRVDATAAPVVDRFVTADSDPTQDRAVTRASSGPGLVIEGPPGTGKSQTIVNLVADAIGRKKTLLLVCQKQAALDVVYKRLEREGLGNRIVMVKDPTKDRRSVLEQIRNQLDQLRAAAGAVSNLQRQRTAVVDKITRIEAQLNAGHHALRRRDEASGRTYRETIGDLIEIEAAGASSLIAPGQAPTQLPDVLDLRSILANVDAETADAVAEQCGALAALWLPSRYEGSSLHGAKPFAADAGTIAQCTAGIEAFALAERRRGETIDKRKPSIEVKDAAALGLWATQHSALLLKLDAVACGELGQLADGFEHGAGNKAIDELVALSADVAAVRGPRIDARLRDLLSTQGDLELGGWITVANDALVPRGWFARLIGGGKASRRKLEQLLAPVSPVVGDPAIQAFLEAAEHERTLRGLKTRLDQASPAAGGRKDRNAEAALTLDGLADQTDANLAALRRVASLHGVLVQAPCRKEAIAAARQGTPAALASLFDAITRALTHNSARRASLTALDRLKSWLEPKWIDTARTRIGDMQSNDKALTSLVAAMPTAEAFQRFRGRAAGLPPLALQAFAALRPLAGDLEAAEPAALNDRVSRLIRREARLAWKQRIESDAPMLAADDAEITALVRSLAQAEDELKRINKEALADSIDRSRLGERTSWDEITRYQGPRSRRLREFLQLGAEIGLMELRPVWLMSPDVASRLLPLVNAMFDTIVFDEASQMPVEYALPTLYRGRTVVVSGDEKQLPPTSFFSSRAVREDDGDDADGVADEIDEEDRDAAVDAWNRREIQDCPNLLELSKSVLATEQLQVHYRSQFRELITFSNLAFYAGTLNVPVRHPEAEVDRHRPLDVVHVGGLYEDRTNAEEADRIVALLEKLWLDGKGEPPTTGVVTFNRDQADLIEDRLESRAEDSEAFRAAYVRESNRVVEGEDMGFFVKNVENVQGDERDHILFSTTFGRNARGTFRRNFGVLGQSGGERRLNVAITRARQRITIFTSMPIDDISDVLRTGEKPAQPRDYLQLYLAYADAISSRNHEGARRLLGQLGAARFERGRGKTGNGDAFVRSVAEAISCIGYAPVHAGDGSAFGIDLAIPHPTSGGFGIGIECDTADHPLLQRPHAREVWRSAVMRRSLPALHRINSRSWYHNRATELTRLRAAIDVAMK